MAAKLHRVEALGAFVASDEPLALAAFGAAKKLEPDFVFPDEWAPPGNPVRELYERGEPDSPLVTAPAPPEGSFRFDGRHSRERAVEHPTLFQWVDGVGDVRVSTYLWPADPLPAYPTPPRASKRGPRRPLWIGAGVAILSSAGLLMGARASRQSYDGAQTTLDNVDARRGLTNGLVIGSGLSFGLGLGAGIVGIAVDR